MCAMRVAIAVPNVSSAPARMPLQGSPVQWTTSRYIASAVSRKPARTSRLWVRRGEAPSQRNGAPMSAGTTSGSVYLQRLIGRVEHVRVEQVKRVARQLVGDPGDRPRIEPFVVVDA